MCCVNPSPSASVTSSLRGQIVASEWPPGSSGGSNPYPDGPPPSPPPTLRAVDADDQEFSGMPAKRARAEPGGGDGVGVADRAAEDGRDRISELPDAVLLSVLSYLPLRDAGRTAVLSSRWRSLFDQSLLDFNACQPFPPEEGRGCEWLIRAVTGILAARPHVRIRSFRFVMYGRGFAGRLGVVHRWFRALALHGVRELNVDMFYTTPKPTLPGSLLQLASLETLKVYCCRFPDAGLARAPPLPALRTLDFSNVNMSQHSLQAILSHCASLECVKLKNIIGVDKICLRSKSLARLYGDFGDLKELVVEDAPNLEELVGIGLPSGNAKVKIVFAPKLQVLGYLGITVRPLVLHDTVFDGGIVQLRTLMRSVKTLAIQLPFSEKGYTVFVAQLLKCFPCLEVLHVEPDKRSISRWVNVEEWDITNSIQCIEHSINRVVFENFGGEECQFGFLTFLLGMARALKLVEFYCWKGIDWASDQVELMLPINRASPDVEFLFFRICNPVSILFLCHCCTQRCQKENRVAMI
ncbi:FBD-associated F-box protein At4g10400-like [Phragmites australis]|uniref:FBD-associated F-box protein At4g10400-like n=1 Tax=Phragmites australis TaxID=29695 RepID=UPI002D76A92D|nr:FBD-associated F-box protein At4g10400-like [Phragmites australis]